PPHPDSKAKPINRTDNLYIMTLLRFNLCFLNDGHYHFNIYLSFMIEILLEKPGDFFHLEFCCQRKQPLVGCLVIVGDSHYQMTNCKIIDDILADEAQIAALV